MSRTTILVVDDDNDNRRLAGEAFIQANPSIRIDYCINGEDLLNYIQRKKEYSNRSKAEPNLILLDLNMPKINGLEALKEIRSYPHAKKISIIIFSSSTRDEDMVNALKLGANEYIVKPVTFGQMVWAFKGLLDKYLTK